MNIIQSIGLLQEHTVRMIVHVADKPLPVKASFSYQKRRLDSTGQIILVSKITYI